MTKRNPWILAVLLVFNIPWVLMWFYFSSGSMDRQWGIPALMMLLTLATIGMVILPMFLTGLPGRRWLLLIMLGTINIFWGLRWVQLFSRYGPGDAAYVDQRAQIVLLMIISSAIVLIGYAWLGRLLLRVPRQTNDTPAARE